MAHAFAGGSAVAFKKGDAPAVAMVVGAAPALRKAGKTQRQARRQVTVHSEKLAHKRWAYPLENGRTVVLETQAYPKMACKPKDVAAFDRK